LKNKKIKNVRGAKLHLPMPFFSSSYYLFNNWDFRMGGGFKPHKSPLTYAPATELYLKIEQTS